MKVTGHGLRAACGHGGRRVSFQELVSYAESVILRLQEATPPSSARGQSALP